MRNSTGNPIFSDFKSFVSRPLVKGNEDPGYEGVLGEVPDQIDGSHQFSPKTTGNEAGRLPVLHRL